ncbi:MAG: cystathionine beta-lyase [Bauldia sp.]
MAERDAPTAPLDIATRLTRLGREADLCGPFANPPVFHASTVLFDSVEEMQSGRTRYKYGRRGTPTLEALERALSDLDGAAGTVLCPSGLTAIAVAMMSAVSAGDHLLVTDNVYDPGRRFADTVLARLGVEITYFDPLAPIEPLFRANTRAVYVESPGSLTFEMSDVPAIAALAHARGAKVIADNSWATPYFSQALGLGADIVLMAATKYIGGHSDVMLGTVSANAACWPALKSLHGSMGLCAGPDDVYLALRGLRTLGVRLDHHRSSALKIAEWLGRRAEVGRVLHPALASFPGHTLWRRDMRGSSGLFSFEPKGWTMQQAAAFVDGLQLFGIGASWGGFESLAILVDLRGSRSVRPRDPASPLIRLHIGLEDADDLIADLDRSFAAVAAAAG